MNEAGEFQRYLSAKRTVDDRAVHTGVEGKLAAALAERESRKPLRVLDVGAGIGGALERLLTRDVLPTCVEYTLLDDREANVETARERLPHVVAAVEYDLRVAEGNAKTRDDSWFDGDERHIRVEPVVADAFEFVARTDRRWDLLIAQSFLDLFDALSAAERLLSVLLPGGLCYFPLTFDGGTKFAPTVEKRLDERIERLYHERIDDGGDSRAGRRLLARLPSAGADVIAAGGSDWVVVPRAKGYPDDEGAFLATILDMVDGALADTALDEEFDAWIGERRAQLDTSELIYIAHQLDVLGRVPGSENKGRHSGPGP